MVLSDGRVKAEASSVDSGASVVQDGNRFVSGGVIINVTDWKENVGKGGFDRDGGWAAVLSG